MIQSFKNIWNIQELRRRVLYTLGLLAVYRIGGHIPTPGVDNQALLRLFEQQSGGILGYVDLFAGGNFRRFTIFALGIMPYITASIILQLLTVVWPYLEKLSKEGEAGRRKITQWTRYGTVLLSFIQSFGIAKWLESASSSAGVGQIVRHPGFSFEMMTVLTLTTGTAFIMWLGEQISERGIGNGISLIIYAGIVVGLAGRGREDDRGLANRRLGDDHDRDPGRHHAGGRRRDRVRRAGAEEDTDPVRPAGRRASGVRRGLDLPAAQRQHRRRHPGDLRLVDDGDPADDRQRRLVQGHRLDPGPPAPAELLGRRSTTCCTWS